MYYPSEFDYGYTLSRGVTIESLNLKLVNSHKGYYDEDCRGLFSQVYKVSDDEGNFYALKCFIDTPPISNEAFANIEKALSSIKSPYFPKSFHYYARGIDMADYESCENNPFPVILTDWFEGVTIDRFVRKNRYDKAKLQKLYDNFCEMAIYLRSQPYAHGNLSHKNILVDEDCNLRLVGFNSFYSPEYNNIGIDTEGSFGFVSTRRSDFEIDSYVDDFSLAAIALMLRCFVLCNGIPVAFPDFFCEYEMRTMPLTTIGKYIIAHSGDIQVAKLFSLLLIADGKGDFRDVPPEIFSPTYQFGYEGEHK